VIYAFDDCELDLRRYELRRDGVARKVEPQVFDVLVLLVRERDRVVLKEEILDTVWGDRFVSESALTSRIKALRQALGDDGTAQRLVRTVRGRGYQFVGDVIEHGGCMADVVAGGRAVVVVSGASGMGKTLLVDAMAAQWRGSGYRLLAGQCIEYRGVGEPYLPLLEATWRMRRAMPSAGTRVEALEHVRVGLDLVTAMDDGPEHHEHELVLQTILGPLLIATRGWASPEVETAYERAHELAGRSADPARALPPILYGLGSLHESRGEYQRAAEVLRQVLELEDIGSAAHHMGSHELLACSLFHQGRFDRAVDHAETGWDLYHPGLHLELQARYGYNPGVGCLTWGALSSWCLGETERANALMAEAFALAHDSDHMFSLASAHEQAAILHQLSEQPTVALDHAATALELGTRPGFRASGRHRTDPVGMVSGRAGRGRRGRRRTAQRDRGPPGHGGPHGPPVLPRAPRRILPSGRRDR
jgi:DNA-binding winged helix-turn-helix (wHTH) protein